MKTLNQYIQEKLIINKDYHDTKIVVKSSDELRKIIEQRYEEYGPGTKRNPIDFNDIDVSNLDSFCNKETGKGIFDNTKFKYIDISDWNVSNIESMRNMFAYCKELESVGDLSNLDVSSVTDMSQMFAFCKKFNQDISKLDVSSVENMSHMFYCCSSFNQDLSSWDVSSVTRMTRMFSECHSFNKDISKWNVSNVINWMYRMNMFDGCPIKEEYKPKFK